MRKFMIVMMVALSLILSGSIAYALESYADSVAKQNIFPFQVISGPCASSQGGEMAMQTKADIYLPGTIGGAVASAQGGYCQTQSCQGQSTNQTFFGNQNQSAFSNQASSGFQSGQTSVSGY